MKTPKAVISVGGEHGAIVQLMSDNTVHCDECGNLTHEFGAFGFVDFGLHVQTHKLRNTNALMDRMNKGEQQ